MAEITPSQTVGPYFAYGLTPLKDYDWKDTFGSDLVTADADGERIRIEGHVADGDGIPITDCMLEIWQADLKAAMLAPAIHVHDRMRCSTALVGRRPTAMAAMHLIRSSLAGCLA